MFSFCITGCECRYPTARALSVKTGSPKMLRLFNLAHSFRDKALERFPIRIRSKQRELEQFAIQIDQKLL